MIRPVITPGFFQRRYINVRHDESLFTRGFTGEAGRLELSFFW